METSEIVRTSESDPHSLAGCMICRFITGEKCSIVLESDRFSGIVSELFPFTVILASKRHCDGPWSLDHTESVELGALIPRLSGALREAGDGWSYFVFLGDGLPAPHFHMGFTTRYAPIHAAVAEVNKARTLESADHAATAAQLASAVRTNLAKA